MPVNFNFGDSNVAPIIDGALTNEAAQLLHLTPQEFSSADVAIRALTLQFGNHIKSNAIREKTSTEGIQRWTVDPYLKDAESMFNTFEKALAKSIPGDKAVRLAQGIKGDFLNRGYFESAIILDSTKGIHTIEYRNPKTGVIDSSWGGPIPAGEAWLGISFAELP